MLVDCCFRLGPYGSVIHTKYDSLSKKFIEYNDLFEPHCFDNMEVRDTFYEQNKYILIDMYRMTEAALLSDPQYVVAIDHNLGEIRCALQEGLVDVKKTPEDASYVTYRQRVLNTKDFSWCGVEQTVYTQLRFQNRVPFRIACKDGYIYTSRGRFYLEYDVWHRLRNFTNDYKLFKKIRDSEDYFGYLFMDTGYALMSLDINNKLILTEVPYGD